MLMLFDSDLDEKEIKDLKRYTGKTKKKARMFSLNQRSCMSEIVHEIKEEEMKFKFSGKLQTNKRKYEDEEHYEIPCIKKKKLNSRLKRLMRIKNKRAAVPQDSKLSPLYTVKEMKWTDVQGISKIKQCTDSESDDSGVESFNSDTIGSKYSHQYSNCDKPLDETVVKNSNKVHIQSSNLGKFQKSQENYRICDVCYKKVSDSCTCLIKTSLNNQPTNWTNKAEVVSLSIVKNPSYLGIPDQYTIPPPEQIVAMDCEFVGVHPKDTSALGRCSVVDFYGNIIYDTYVKPDTPITHYRTKWSGIRKRDMRYAVPFRVAQDRLKNILQGKIVVGHALYNDFKVIKIHHLGRHIRDTSGYKPLRALANLSERTSASLKNLSKNLLERPIQQKEHCSVEDCIATIDLYKLVRDEWEQTLLNKALKRQTDNNGNEDDKVDTPCDSKTFLSDEFWPQYLFPSSDHA